MTYTIPDQVFDAQTAARNRVIRAQQFRDLLISQYKSGYEAMWQTPRTHGEKALSLSNMQAVLNQSQPTFVDILTDSAGFIAYVAQAYPEALQPGTDDEGNPTEPLLPARYTSSPYEHTTGPTGITLTSLKPEWEAQDDED